MNYLLNKSNNEWTPSPLEKGGMRLVWSYFILLLFISSCTTQKVTSQTNTSPTVKPKEEKTGEVFQEEKKQDDLPLGPDTFDIGLILPFYLDSVSRLPDSVEVNYFDQSTLAIEFYNGVKMALNQLSSFGFNARLHVYDDMNDKERVKKIAQLPVFKKLDLLLGPVYNNNLRLMAESAKRDSVFMVSPLSPAMNITNQNPYYIMVNPSIEVHCKKLFAHAIHRYNGNNILLFTRPGSAVEEQYASLFRTFLNEYHAETGDTSVQFTEVRFLPKDEGGDDLTSVDEALAKNFSSDGYNIVIVPSVDKAYIHSIARKLYAFIEPPKEIEDAPKFAINILGLPAWGDQEGMRLDYAQKLNVHFTSSSFIAPDFYSPANPFYKSYVDSFHAEPSEYAIKGYDLMLFFGNLLVKYGAQVDSMLYVEQFNGIHTKFRFGIHPAELNSPNPIDGSPAIPVTDFIENKYVRLLKYEGYEVKEVE